MTLVESTDMSRILVTDAAGKVLYDTRETDGAVGDYALYTEVVQALLGNDAFTWLSSARVVRCWVKSRNERNPYC